MSSPADTVLETERLLLRPWGPEDARVVGAIYGDPEVMRLYGNREPWDRERIERAVAKMIAHQCEHGFSPWALILKESGQIIGHCGLEHCPDTGEIEISYVLGRDWWGRGLATEAARAALAHGASIAILKKLGMTLDRTVPLFGHELLLYAIGEDELTSPCSKRGA
jgi:ribosomal-protein-alanine N-acetyltransferase